MCRKPKCTHLNNLYMNLNNRRHDPIYGFHAVLKGLCRALKISCNISKYAHNRKESPWDMTVISIKTR